MLSPISISHFWNNLLDTGLDMCFLEIKVDSALTFRIKITFPMHLAHPRRFRSTMGQVKVHEQQGLWTPSDLGSTFQGDWDLKEMWNWFMFPRQPIAPCRASGYPAWPSSKLQLAGCVVSGLGVGWSVPGMLRRKGPLAAPSILRQIGSDQVHLLWCFGYTGTCWGIIAPDLLASCRTVCVGSGVRVSWVLQNRNRNFSQCEAVSVLAEVCRNGRILQVMVKICFLTSCLSPQSSVNTRQFNFWKFHLKKTWTGKMAHQANSWPAVPAYYRDTG